MITALHALLYSEDPPTTRAFLRDVLGWPFLEHSESGPGWLIFRSGPSEIAVHPAGPPTGVHHEVSFMCDNLDTTMAELRVKGAAFEGEIEEQRWGRLTRLVVPGAGAVLLYEPKYPPAHTL